MEAHPFQSARLMFCDIGPEADTTLQALQADDIGNMMAFPGQAKPAGKAAAESSRKWLNTCLLGVLVSLRPEEAQKQNLNGSSTASTSEVSKSDSEKKSTPIGILSLSASGPPFAHHRESMIGIQFLAPYRGKGYGTEAIEWVLDYGFSLMGLHRIVIGTQEYNEGARRLYARMGFKLESTKRKATWFNGRWWDDYGFGMLEEEWRERRKFDEFGQLSR